MDAQLVQALTASQLPLRMTMALQWEAATALAYIAAIGAAPTIFAGLVVIVAMLVAVVAVVAAVVVAGRTWPFRELVAAAGFEPAMSE